MGNKEKQYANWYEGDLFQISTGGDMTLKEWDCVKVGYHKDVGKTIEEWQKNGWHLHNYQAIGTSGNPSHYLLFERGE